MTDELVEARKLLKEALALAPLCYRRDCREPAVYSSPTAVIGDRLLTCEEHKGPEENEFGDERYELRAHKLNLRILKFLDETGAS